MKKIKTIAQVAMICKRLRRHGKTIGLITGCFDVIHIGHVELFGFAKKHCDILVIGLDNDTTIRLSKGPQRPIFPWKYRAKLLAELSLVDFVFKIVAVTEFGVKAAEKVYNGVYDALMPHSIFTTPSADKFWKSKK
jgi:D-beta-D-heptose 7-phosphate kinase/D-beta-D-heptose 1-phosphate adenosyltransferase